MLKLLFSFMFFVIGINISYAGHETGNGGNICAARFKSMARTIAIEISENDYYSDLFLISLFKQKVETAKVEIVNHQLSIGDSLVDAINYPARNLIQVSSNWCISTYPNRPVLVFHEYLGLLDATLDATYEISLSLYRTLGVTDEYFLDGNEDTLDRIFLNILDWNTIKGVTFRDPTDPLDNCWYKIEPRSAPYWIDAPTQFLFDLVPISEDREYAKCYKDVRNFTCESVNSKTCTSPENPKLGGLEMKVTLISPKMISLNGRSLREIHHVDSYLGIKKYSLVPVSYCSILGHPTFAQIKDIYSDGNYRAKHRQFRKQNLCSNAGGSLEYQPKTAYCLRGYCVGQSVDINHGSIIERNRSIIVIFEDGRIGYRDYKGNDRLVSIDQLL